MKKVCMIVMAAAAFSSFPVFAAEHGDMNMDKMEMHEGMNMDMHKGHEGMHMDSHDGMKMATPEGMRECALQAESIQQKIKRIQGEISKGSNKYSAEDLKKLNATLKEANDTLDNLGKR